MPYSYLTACWELTPIISPNCSWVRPSMSRRSRIRLATSSSIVEKFFLMSIISHCGKWRWQKGAASTLAVPKGGEAAAILSLGLELHLQHAAEHVRVAAQVD